MNKILHVIILLSCLFITACDKSNEPEPKTIHPIHFDKTDYTIALGDMTGISFTGGGGIYKLTASNPAVLGKYGMDIETNRLVINPKTTGNSTLTIVDVKTETTVTLNITVVDFYFSFKVDEIAGKNNNPYINIGDEIRFIRDTDNTKPIIILTEDNSNHSQIIAANGHFDILRSETNIFTMLMALHSNQNEELKTFEYTMSGDGEYMSLFDNYFGFGWDKSFASSRAQPARKFEMILTDNFNGCKITCILQPISSHFIK